MSTYTCFCCGRLLDGLPTDRAYTLPDDVWALPEAERDGKVKWDSDLCQFGERYFIRALLELPFRDRDGYFGWGLWVEVERPVFERYLALYDEDATAEPPHPASMANRPEGYEPVTGIPASVQFGIASQRPKIVLSTNSEHQLAIDAALGIASDRYHRILEHIGALEPRAK